MMACLVVAGCCFQRALRFLAWAGGKKRLRFCSVAQKKIKSTDETLFRNVPWGKRSHLLALCFSLYFYQENLTKCYEKVKQL